MKKALVGTNPLENLFRRDSNVSIYQINDLSRASSPREFRKKRNIIGINSKENLKHQANIKYD